MGTGENNGILGRHNKKYEVEAGALLAAKSYSMRNIMIDYGGRRSGMERRTFLYAAYLHKRKSGIERRNRVDRRSGVERRSTKGSKGKGNYDNIVTHLSKMSRIQFCIQRVLSIW